ncbi:hypothetical protein SAMN05216548_12629 [Faunimonas pinastri]|uniref:Uncharacterized protein n=2 Tax=Faunimonas pinastri TaxID=1855383 RepID=A0A1H9QAM1_9HYPH|nr:hypothetical protein SAMN05216548_12629 [Faunimonas pinastri]
MRSGISALRRLQLEAVGNLIDLLDESEGDSDLEPSCGSEAAALNPQMDECEPVSEHDDRERDDADLEPALGWASGAFGEWERAHA